MLSYASADRLAPRLAGRKALLTGEAVRAIDPAEWLAYVRGREWAILRGSDGDNM